MVFYMNSFFEKSPEYFEELESMYQIKIPVPGLKLEDLKVSVKNSTVSVEWPETLFTSKNKVMYTFDKIKSKGIRANVSLGVLTIEVDKPKDLEFEVNITGE